MSRKKKDAFFWVSYSDLMTTLFFIMLVLFVLTILLLNREIRATQAQLNKIREIEEALNRLDAEYFAYNPTYKKHVLRVRVNFAVGEYNMATVDGNSQRNLIRAGQSLQDLLYQISREHPEIQYLLVIEGQASKDQYQGNYALSYNRALALRDFWRSAGIDFGLNTEVLISGSGIGGTMREREERLNQRFLIHIIPKPGMIDATI